MAFQRGRKRKLVADPDKLTHSAHMREASEFGRDHAGTTELRQMLDSLDGGLSQWQFRLYAARAAGETSDIVDALSSPLRSVRSLAIRSMLTLDVDVTSQAGAIEGLSTSDRRALLAVIRKRGDTAVADRLVGEIYERFGAEEASMVVSACSGPVVAEWLPGLAHAVSSWPKIVRAHPDVFVDFLRGRMSMAPIVRDAWWARAAPGIGELATVAPSSALDLWIDFGPDREIPRPIQLNLPRLATEDVNRTLTKLLEPAFRVQLPSALGALRRRIASAEDGLVAQLAQVLVPDASAFATVLEAVAPSRRADLFDRATADIDTSQVSWKPAVLKALPYEVRHRETRRMLDLPAYREAEGARHELMVWLPIEETWDELRAATEAHDADRRAMAYRRLVAAVLASGDPDYVDRLLSELQRLRNEQDPVRAQAFAALSQCPAHLIHLDNMGSVDELVGFAVDARDTSRQTVRALTTLLHRVLVNSATVETMPVLKRCVDALAKLAGQSGQLQIGPLHHSLPPRGEFVLYEALEPRLRADLRAGRPELLFSLVRSLGPRGHAVGQLDAHLEELTKSRTEVHASRAIQLWLAIPNNRGPRLERLLARDPSAVLVPGVFRLVSLVRQDLLDAALSDRALTGRFATSNIAQIPVIDHGFHRWGPSTRRAYAALLKAAANNEHTGYLRMAAIRALARIPEVGTEQLRTFLQSDDVVTVEAALSGLSWGESPGAELANLLSYANSDRARVAVYAAARAARFSQPDEVDRAIGELLEADDSKLTSRKEALRILGQNRTPAALDILAALWARRPIHRSIAIALASALRNYPDRDLTWEVYRELATGDGDTAFAVAESMDPLSWPEDRRSELAVIGGPLVQHDVAAVREVAWPRLAALRPWNESISGLLSDAVADLETVTSWRPAMRQLHLLLDGYPDDPVLAETVRRLAVTPLSAEVAEARDRDLSIPQRLEALASTRPASALGRATMRLAAEHLVDAGFAAEATMFEAGGVDWSAPETTLRRLARLAGQHPAALPPLYQVTSDMLEVAATSGRWSAGDLIATAEELSDGAEADGLVATAIVGAAGPKSGWAEPWRQLLVRLRQHDSVWVQSRASSIRTSRE